MTKSLFLVACRMPVFALAILYIPLLGAETWPAKPLANHEKVGQSGLNRVVTPVNQTITPAGLQVDLPFDRSQGFAGPFSRR